MMDHNMNIRVRIALCAKFSNYNSEVLFINHEKPLRILFNFEFFLSKEQKFLIPHISDYLGFDVVPMVIKTLDGFSVKIEDKKLLKILFDIMIQDSAYSKVKVEHMLKGLVLLEDIHTKTGMINFCIFCSSKNKLLPNGRPNTDAGMNLAAWILVLSYIEISSFYS